MYTKLFTKIVFLILVAFLAAGCQFREQVIMDALAQNESQIQPLIEQEFQADQNVGSNLSAVETVDAFYAWLYSLLRPTDGEMRNPVVEGLYRGSPYLTRGLIEDVDSLRQAFEQDGKGGYDPFFLAQDIPQSVEAELVSEEGDSARVVLHQSWSGMQRDLTLFLLREDDAWKIDRIAPGSPLTPEGLTELFLNLYISSIQDRMLGLHMGSQTRFDFDLVDYISYEFFTKIHASQEAQGEPSGAGFDPILLAQDLPQAVQVKEVVQDGEQARVLVEQYWSGNPLPRVIQVYLNHYDGSWRIVDILPEDQEADASTPSGGVNAFYAWYLHQARLVTPGSAGIQPIERLSESQLVTDGFVQRVNDIRASFSDQSGYDPVLCAQNIPPALWAEAEKLSGDRASVLVKSDFPGYFLVVDLESTGDTWLVSDVSCSFDPQTTVKAFYTWYLDYIGDPSGEFRNPLVDGAYRESPFLSEEFVLKVEGILASFENAGGYDPILQAQNIPQAIEVEPGTKDENVTVRERFGDSWQELDITLVQEDGRWLIDDIQRRAD